MFELKIDHEKEALSETFGIPNEMVEEIAGAVVDSYKETDDWSHYAEDVFNKYKDKFNETQMTYVLMRAGDFMRYVIEKQEVNPISELVKALSRD